MRMWFVNMAFHRDSAFSGPVPVPQEATHVAQGVAQGSLPARGTSSQQVCLGGAPEAKPAVWDAGPSSNRASAELEMEGIQVSSTLGLSWNSGPAGMFFPVQHVPL